MNLNCARQFTQTVRFLGSVLGPDYEITLYDLEAEGNPLVAIANGRLSGQTIGSPLPDTIQAALSPEDGESDFALHATNQLQVSGRTIRTSTMLIRDEQGKPVGLLGINFDDSRYLELCGQLLELIHPDAYAAEQYAALERSAGKAVFRKNRPDGGAENTREENPETLHNDVSSMTREIFAQTVSRWSIPLDRLTPEERMELLAELEARGLFRLKGAVQYTARQLSTSPASVYRYLSRIRQTGSQE